MSRHSLRALSVLGAASFLSVAGPPAAHAGPQAPAALSPPSVQYHVTRTVALGAPDHWDYVVVDPSTHRVYVAHGDRLTVVNGRSGAILGQVAGFPGGTHGTAVIDALGRGYTDDGDAGEAGAFDLRTLKVVKRIKAADDADSIALDPVSGHVFVVDGHPGLITVIDPKRNEAVATVKGDPDLEYAVAGGDGKVYVNGAGSREIIRIDTRSNEVDARWPIANCESPHGLAVDRRARRLFASCLNAVLVVVNMDTGAEVATLPIGKGSDSAAFDPRHKLVFSANGRDGTLSVIWEKTPETYVPLATVKTAVTGRTLGIDTRTGRLYIAAARPQPGAAPPAWSKLAPPPVVPGSLELLFLDPRP